MKKLLTHPIMVKGITLFKAHKIIGTVLAVAVVGGGYFAVGAMGGETAETRYITEAVSRGTLISSISGVGQVSVSEQVEIQPKVSGEVVRVYVSKGQTVSAGTLLALLDTRDAEKAVRDAETNLETAKLELDRMLEPVDELTLLQAENSLIQAKNSKQKAEDNLIKAYEDGFNTVADAFLDLPTVMGGMENLLFGKSINNQQDNITWYINATDHTSDARSKAERFRDDVYASYNKARTAYTKNFDDYKAVSRFSEEATIEAIIKQTYDTAQLIAEAVKAANNYIDFVQDHLEQRHLQIPSQVSTHQSSLDSYTGTTNSNLSSLLSIQSTLKTSREAIVDAETNIEERELSLAKTKAGADELNIRAQNITIQQREDALITAKQNLNDHYIRAPFAGVVATVDVSLGKAVSSGSKVATLLANQQIVEIALNEIDAVKIKGGQRATITFDAVPDLTVTGEVVSIATLGTVSQGVVSYDVTVVFDIEDTRIKPGMSASVSIITEAKQDALLVSNSAIRYQGANTSILAMGTEGVPVTTQVTVGSSNDTHTEIVNGLQEGDTVVTQTITENTGNSSQSAAQSGGGNSIIPTGGGFGGGGGGGGGVRFQVR